MKKRMQKKLALVLGYNCNNNCRFCYSGDKKNLGIISAQQAKREMKRGIERGCSIVDFIGGEPTIRKDLFELVSFAKKLDYNTISITTNGRMLSYKSYTKKLVDSGLNSVIFSIHSHTSKLHDFLTRARGSYEELTRGMRNVKEINPEIYICTNTTINRYNYKYLPEIGENNIKLGADACEMIFLHPRGNALENFEEMIPSLTELSPYIPKTLIIGEKYGIKHFVFRYLPLCFMLGFENKLSEFESRNRLKEQHIGPEFEDFNVEEGRKKIGRVKGKMCRKCKYDNICEGIFKEYAERRGLKELRPVE